MAGLWRLSANRRLRGSGLLGADVDLAALELDRAVLEREDGVILVEADVVAGLVLGAALADDDAAGGDELPAKDLDAAVLRVAVAAVAGGTLTLLMCHKSPLLLRKAG